METSLMETDEIVFGNPVAEHAETNEVVPVEVSETRAKPPEIEKSPVQQVNILDLSKLSPEVQQGYRVYMEMSADSYKNVTWPFLEPVDAEKLGLWDYHERIKEPMSFHQIGYKFNNYQYNSITEVVGDIRLILENCYRYNGSNHWVSKLGHKMEKILEQKLALLNRSLRDKVSLEATMALRSEFTPAESTGTDGTSRRRTAARVSYVNMINGEGSSSLLTRLKIQEDIEERERRRIREKEKKEANLVLLQDLAKWEEKELGPDLVKQLHSMWEIPSLAGLLFLLKDFLFIQDLNITELELSFIYANKSSLLARIFTALLVTPHQRKSLFKKPPMKFKVWESKLCDRLNSWYKAIEKDGQMFTCHNLGLDMATFEMLGEENPLLEKSYMDLTLHQRVWILKCLCDNSLVRDYDFREHLSTIAPTEQRDVVLGNDANSWSYLYFPIFSASDLRIYKQCPLDVPTLSKRKKKVAPPPPPPPPPAPTKAKGTSTRPATPTQPKRDSRLRKLRKGTPSPEPEAPNPPSPPPAVEEQEQEPKKTIAEGFELAAFDVESLKKLCEKFAEPPPPPKKRGRKPKPPPPRKRCEIDLHASLLALVEELEKYEVSFSKLMSKAKIKIMKESQEPEPVDEPEEVVPAAEEEEWGSEESVEDEIEDAGARNMSSDEDFILENEESGNNKSPTSEQVNEDGEEGENKGNAATQISLPQKRKAEEAASIVEESKQSVVSPGIYDEDDSCTIAIQTTPPRLKKKRKKHSPGTEVKPEAVPQTAAATVLQGETAVMPSTSLPKIPQGIRQNILHIPAALHSVTGKRTVDVTGRTSATVNTNNTVSVSGLSTKSVLPSTRVTQPERKASSVRILSRTPATLNASASSTVAAQPSSSVVVSSTTLCGTASNQAVTVSKSVTTASVSVAAQHLQSQLSAAVSAGLGKVMLVSSSGAPLQVLKTVSVSQPLIQGNTSNPAVLTTQESTGKCVVPSSSSLLNHVGVATLTSSSLIAKSTTSQLPSSAAPKVAISVTPSKLSSVLSASPVFLVQRPGSGGVVPLAVKGGAIVMPPSSAPQQVVVIRPSSSLTSSTTSTTTQLSGTGIAVLGNTQIAQTALGHKVLLSTTLPPKTKIVNKPVDQVAKTPLQVKPSEIKNSSLALGNKPITVKTTASSTSSVTTASNSTILVTRVPDPKPNCATLPVGNEQAGLETVASSEITVANKQSVNVGSNRVCDTERSGIAIATLASNLEPVKETESHEMTTVSPERDLAQTKVICEDESLPLKTINTSKSSRPEITADGIVEEKARIELHDTDKDAENGSDPLVDLTCYETSVSDSTCGESDDSTAPNGLHPDLKTSVPCKRVEIDVKLCNGVGRSVTPDTNSVEQELDSGERSHAVTDQATNGVLMTET